MKKLFLMSFLFLLLMNYRLFPTQNIYRTKVHNLRLREDSSLNSKIIRNLNYLENVEIMEKGKTETINNVAGVWIKVKTSEYEVGWCFDAYLESVVPEEIVIDKNYNLKDFEYLYLSNDGDLFLTDLIGKNKKQLTYSNGRISEYDYNGNSILISICTNEFDVEDLIYEINLKENNISNILDLRKDFHFLKKNDEENYKKGLKFIKYNPNGNGDFIYWSNDFYYYSHENNKAKKFTENVSDLPRNIKWKNNNLIIKFQLWEGVQDRIFKIDSNGEVKELSISKTGNFISYASNNELLGFNADGNVVVLKTEFEAQNPKLMILDLSTENYIKERAFNDLRELKIFEDRLISFIDPNNSDMPLISNITNDPMYKIYEINFFGEIKILGDFSGFSKKFKILGNTEQVFYDKNLISARCFDNIKDGEIINEKFLIYNYKTKELVEPNYKTEKITVLK